MLCCYPFNLDLSRSPQAAKLMKIIMVLACIQFVVAILSFFVSIMMGIYDLVGAVILVCIYSNKNWGGCACYIVISLADFLFGFLAAGNLIVDDVEVSGFSMFLFCVILLKMPYFVVSIYYVFLTYKELKALKIESAYSNEMVPFTSSSNQQPQATSNPQPQRNPFEGRGHRVG